MKKHRDVWKRLIACMLIMLLAMPRTAAVTALADARVGTQKVLTLGADLTEEEKQLILRFFDVDESEVVTMTITNQDERDHLLGLIPESQIGTKTFSCALVCPTDRGGIQVTTANMSYVTSELIASTLATSGVTNCDVLTAAPFRVSGTGALTGAMMSYETASGEILDEAKKDLANEELVITNDLGDTVGQDEAILIVNGVKIRIAKDQVKGEEEVKQVVDEVADNAEAQLNERAQTQGTAPVEIGQEDRDKLYSYGNKFSQLDYNYDDMKVTLQRVTENTMEITGITDPVSESFEDLGENAVSGDSILTGVNDDALGEDAGVNSTYVTVEAETEGPSIGMAQQSSEQLAFPVREVSLKEIRSFSDKSFEMMGSGCSLRYRDDNWNYGLLDLEGNKLTEALYQRISCDRGYFTVVDTNGKYGVLSPDGKVVVPCEYDYLPYIRSSYWTAAMMLEQVAAGDEDYDVYSGDDHFRFSQIDLFDIKAGSAVPVRSLTREEYRNLFTFGSFLEINGVTYDRNLNELPEDVSSSYSEEDGTIYHKVREEKADYSSVYGVTDNEGNTLLSPVYSYISSFQYGFGEAKEAGAEGMGLYAAGDNMVIPSEYTWTQKTAIAVQTEDGQTNVYSYCPAGYFRANKDDKMYYLTWGGQVTGEVPVKRDQLDYNCGAACSFIDLESLRHTYSADGVEVTYPEEYQYVRPLDETGLLWYAQTADYDYYLYDWHGNKMIEEPSGTSFRISDDGRYVLMAGKNYGDFTLYEVTYHTDEGDLHCYQTGKGADFTAAETEVAVSETVEETETTVSETAAETEAAVSETPAETETPVTQAAQQTEAAATEAAQQNETAVTEAAQQTEAAATEAAQQTEAAATEAPETVPETEAAGTTDPTVQTALSVLDSAVMLLDQDASANAATAAELIHTSAELIRAAAPGAAGILDSAKVLLESGSADLSSVKTLIDTAKGMM